MGRHRDKVRGWVAMAKPASPVKMATPPRHRAEEVRVCGCFGHRPALHGVLEPCMLVCGSLRGFRGVSWVLLELIRSLFVSLYRRPWSEIDLSCPAPFSHPKLT